MHIAICDDEHKELLHIQALVKEFDSHMNISLFPSSESLLEGATRQHFDVILLDIEMDGMNGFTAATKLVKMQNPPLIVFVTNSGEYTYRGYEVAFDYIIKPVSYEVLAGVLARAMAKIAPQKFTITENGHSYVIAINDILYLESFGHYLIIHTEKNDYECRMKLSDAAALLPGNTFSSPHRGYLVNLDYVDTVGDYELTLVSDAQIPISRRQKQRFEQALFRFVRRLQ